jgi:hypothetical protein
MGSGNLSYSYLCTEAVQVSSQEIQQLFLARASSGRTFPNPDPAKDALKSLQFFGLHMVEAQQRFDERICTADP